jgi:hypothetical protein
MLKIFPRVIGVLGQELGTKPIYQLLYHCSFRVFSLDSYFGFSLICFFMIYRSQGLHLFGGGVSAFPNFPTRKQGKLRGRKPMGGHLSFL